MRRAENLVKSTNKHLKLCNDEFNMDKVKLHFEEIVTLKTRSYVPDILSPLFFYLMKHNKSASSAVLKINGNGGKKPCDVSGLIIDVDITNYLSVVNKFKLDAYNIANGMVGGSCESSYGCKLPHVCEKNTRKCHETVLSSSIDKAYLSLLQIEYVALVVWLDNNELVSDGSKVADRTKLVKIALDGFHEDWQLFKKEFLSQTQGLLINTIPENWDRLFQSKDLSTTIRNIDLDLGHVNRFLTRGGEIYYTAYATHKKLRELRVNILALLKQLLNEGRGGDGDTCTWDDSNQQLVKRAKPPPNPIKTDIIKAK